MAVSTNSLAEQHQLVHAPWAEDEVERLWAVRRRADADELDRSPVHAGKPLVRPDAPRNWTAAMVRWFEAGVSDLEQEQPAPLRRLLDRLAGRTKKAAVPHL